MGGHIQKHIQDHVRRKLLIVLPSALAVLSCITSCGLPGKSTTPTEQSAEQNGESSQVATRKPNSSNLEENRSPGNQSNNKPGPTKPPPRYDRVSPNCTNGTLLTYENFAKSFIATYCLSCHSSSLDDTNRGGTPTGMNFDNLEDIKLRNHMIVRSLRPGSNNSMPPSQQLPQNIKNAMLQWLYCGAPQ